MQISSYFENEIRPFSPNTYTDKVQSFLEDSLPADIICPKIVEAFTHKSFTHETNKVFSSYERLEFLGDSVLQILVSEKIMMQFPDLDEGQLSKLRSSIVNESTLSQFFQCLNLQNYILLGRGELSESGHKKTGIQANVFESILGALYLDGGLNKAETFLNKAVSAFEKEKDINVFSLDSALNFDSKSTLQEIVMKKHQTLPEYIIREEKNEFNIQLKIKEKIIASIIHKSKKKGMQQLAQNVLNQNLIERQEG